MNSKGVRLLSTRPLSKQIVEQAALKNVCIEEIEFIRTETIIEHNTIAAIKTFLQEDCTVIFTSMNAVEAVAANIDADVHWRIYCMGNTTKNLVHKYFGDVITGTGHNASDLANEIIANKEKEVIFFCGDKRRNELPEILSKNKVSIKEVIVYKTIPLEVKLNRQYDGILFYSPSAVESFFANNLIGSNTILFAIGETTASAIKQYSSNQIIISDEAGKDRLVEKVISFYNNKTDTKTIST